MQRDIRVNQFQLELDSEVNMTSAPSRLIPPPLLVLGIAGNFLAVLFLPGGGTGGGGGGNLSARLFGDASGVMSMRLSSDRWRRVGLLELLSVRLSSCRWWRVGLLELVLCCS